MMFGMNIENKMSLYKCLISLLFDFNTYHFAVDEYKHLTNELPDQSDLHRRLEDIIARKISDIHKYISSKYGDGDIENIFNLLDPSELEDLVRYMARLSM